MEKGVGREIVHAGQMSAALHAGLLRLQPGARHGVDGVLERSTRAPCWRVRGWEWGEGVEAGENGDGCSGTRK